MKVGSLVREILEKLLKTSQDRDLTRDDLGWKLIVYWANI